MDSYTNEDVERYFIGSAVTDTQKREIAEVFEALKSLLKIGLRKSRRVWSSGEVIFSVDFPISHDQQGKVLFRAGKIRGKLTTVSGKLEQVVLSEIEIGKVSSRLSSRLVPLVRAALHEVISAAERAVPEAGVAAHFDFFIAQSKWVRA